MLKKIILLRCISGKKFFHQRFGKKSSYPNQITHPPQTSNGQRIAEAEFCVILTVFSHWIYKMKYSCYQDPLLFMAGLFIGFLVEKCATYQKKKSEIIVFKN